MHPKLDPRFTFDTFVTGSGNRLASSAARRSAESPGGTCNPLVVYGPSGMGKTHLLQALGHSALEQHPSLRVVYEPMAAFVDRLSSALAANRIEAFRKDYVAINLHLLDDAQFLIGKVRTQDELLPLWGSMGRNGGQVVLAADRAPTDIDRLDMRLTARFARALIVDIAPPDTDMRTAIVRKKADERGIEINEGVAPALARLLTGGVHELLEGLDRIAEVQERQGAALSADEIAPLLGMKEVFPVAAPRTQREWSAPVRASGAVNDDLVLEENPFEAFLFDITETVAEIVEATPWRTQLSEAILRWGGEGIRTWRLEAALAAEDTPEVERLIESFAADASRLLEIAREVAELDPHAASAHVLVDPDRLAEAETLLLATRLASRPLPAPPAGSTLDSLPGRDTDYAHAIPVARRVATSPGGEHNPLFVHGPTEHTAHLLSGIANAARVARPHSRIAFASGAELTAELLEALDAGYLDVWRRRYEQVDIFVLDGIEAMIGSQRAQETVLSLVDTLVQARSQVVFGASTAPRRLPALDSRLLQRVESGFVLDLGASPRRRLLNPRASTFAPATAAVGERASGPDRWFFNREKVAWGWVALGERVIEELD